MKGLILYILLLLPVAAYGQSAKEKGMVSINEQSAEAYITFLASDALQGREAGKPGGEIAAEYLKSILMDIGIKPLGESYFQPFEAYSRERQKRTRYTVHPDSIHKYKAENTFRKLYMQNVLGYIEGKRKDEFIIIGAHYDHLGIDDALAGDKIYNGADDNASGVSAVLQIAKAFVESGEKPLRSVIFAFWDGEELGLLGSEYYMLTCKEYSRIKAYLNFDMVGRNKDENKPRHVDYFYTEAHPSFGEWLRNDIETYNLRIEPVYRPWDNPMGGSDNGSFAKRNIPIIWYHTDGHADYHQPSDHTDKINWDKLVEITKAAYLNAWNLANIEIY